MAENRYSNFDSSNLRDSAILGGSTIAAFSIGLGVGAGLALLFAPKRGDELRSDIANRASGVANRASDLADRARDQFANVRNKVGNVRGDSGSRATDFAERASGI
jgi:gas vesicle protein